MVVPDGAKGERLNFRSDTDYKTLSPNWVVAVVAPIEVGHGALKDVTATLEIYDRDSKSKLLSQQQFITSVDFTLQDVRAPPCSRPHAFFIAKKKPEFSLPLPSLDARAHQIIDAPESRYEVDLKKKADEVTNILMGFGGDALVDFDGSKTLGSLAITLERITKPTSPFQNLALLVTFPAGIPKAKKIPKLQIFLEVSKLQESGAGHWFPLHRSDVIDATGANDNAEVPGIAFAPVSVPLEQLAAGAARAGGDDMALLAEARELRLALWLYRPKKSELLSSVVVTIGGAAGAGGGREGGGRGGGVFGGEEAEGVDGGAGEKDGGGDGGGERDEDKDAGVHTGVGGLRMELGRGGTRTYLVNIIKQNVAKSSEGIGSFRAPCAERLPAWQPWRPAVSFVSPRSFRNDSLGPSLTAESLIQHQLAVNPHVLLRELLELLNKDALLLLMRNHNRPRPKQHGLIIKPTVRRVRIVCNSFRTPPLERQKPVGSFFDTTSTATPHFPAASSTAANTASTLPTTRTNTSALAAPATTFAAAPPEITPTFTVVPSSKPSTMTSSTSNTARTNFITAESPSSGYPECASTPSATILTFSIPFDPVTISPSVGSAITTTSDLTPSSFAATIPAWSTSSPTTSSIPKSASSISSAATIIAAKSPFVSHAQLIRRDHP
eukprot:CAMPEP_0174892682 /NCGR_PEP_ID=MMETSP0167-20121228/7600_1 /TAXON_ID=38298 /ORGANISM="Rhodella maculata, Strain CCMP736" /LENGTH=665 /DNA_ID=CAMNT_0016131257 /DNA_START=72 /DNA_END=2067 /DNA_ORIENTATION=+